MEVTLFRLLLLIFIAVTHIQGQITLTADVDMIGIKGDLTVSQAGLDQTVSFTFNLQGISGTVTWELRESWVDYTVRDKCADSMLGSRYMDNIGGTINNGSESQPFPLGQLPDARALLGRSIVLMKGNDKACATFKKAVDYTTGYVRIQDADIVGDVWFRQAQGERTEILADFFDARTATSVNLNWEIYSGTGSDCRAMSAFGPTTPAGVCSTNNQAACQVGDLSGKHGQLPIGQTMGSTRKFFHDVNLDLSGTNSVLNKYLVLLDGDNQIVSCSMINEVTEKVAKATVSRDKVRGYIKFTQKSPFDVTNVYPSLFGFNNTGGGYHVHLFPVPTQVLPTDQLCSVENVGGHWNPFGKPFPATGTTTDQFEIGDLSRKYGSLSGEDTLAGTFHDYNLPLFGEFSIVGRSFVVHKDMPTRGNPRWMCSNIEIEGDMNVAIANFKSPVIGTVIFAQPRNDPAADTWVYGELNYADGTDFATTGHMWMIHQNMADGSCDTVGGMYNPFNVTTQTDYTTQCSSANPLRCQVGDGTRLTSPLSIRKTNKMPQKYFFSTKNMPLSGPGSVIGRSVVIYAANSEMAKLACTNIYQLRARDAIVDTWSNDVKGYFKFSQAFSNIASPTLVSMNVTNLNSIAGKYHVHIFPVAPNNANPCSGLSVSDHYNPFKFDPKKSPPSGQGTFDQYESGDLSGKKGLMENKMTYDASYADSMLYLFGARSVVGRSIVIHKMADGSRWTCGSIRENTDMTGGRLHTASAEFLENGIKGIVMLSQYSYPDGSMSDTDIYIYINNTDGRETMDHKITIGGQPAYGDRKSVTNRCMSTSTIFNPFSVNMESGYDECSISNPLRCAAGDVTGKQTTYAIGGGKMFVTDVNLPLVGKHSVIGLPVVLHAANGGSSKIACSNIKPEGVASSEVTVDVTSGNVLYKMAEYFSQYLNTDMSNVAVFEKETKDDCGAFEVYFLGTESHNLKTKFDRAVISDQLSRYKPTVCAADAVKVSLLLMAVLFVCKIVLV